jgi:hypothetical protein
MGFVVGGSPLISTLQLSIDCNPSRGQARTKAELADLEGETRSPERGIRILFQLHPTNGGCLLDTWRTPAAVM